MEKFIKFKQMLVDMNRDRCYIMPVHSGQCLTRAGGIFILLATADERAAVDASHDVRVRCTQAGGIFILLAPADERAAVDASYDVRVRCTQAGGIFILLAPADQRAAVDIKCAHFM